ncbi:hypothetical protein AB5I41_07330 [Sphingomonas sp. MMS24-JH45]
MIAIYLLADAGSIGGGWLSSSLMKRGWNVNAARKAALLVCALCVVPVFSAASVPNLWGAVAILGLAAAAHQGWSSNLYAIVSDSVPRSSVASVMGIGGWRRGGMIMAKYVGHVLETIGSYWPVLLGQQRLSDRAGTAPPSSPRIGASPAVSSGDVGA